MASFKISCTGSASISPLTQGNVAISRLLIICRSIRSITVTCVWGRSVRAGTRKLFSVISCFSFTVFFNHSGYSPTSHVWISLQSFATRRPSKYTWLGFISRRSSTKRISARRPGVIDPISSSSRKCRAALSVASFTASISPTPNSMARATL